MKKKSGKQTCKALVLFILPLLLSSCNIKQDSIELSFSASNTKGAISIKDIDPNLPSDWSEYKYLLVEMRINTPEFFWFGFGTEDGLLTNRILTFPNTWVKMSLPLDYYRASSTEGEEMSALWGRTRITGRMSLFGDKSGELRGVDSIHIRLEHKPAKDVKLEIRSLSLQNSDTGEVILDPVVLIDKFGQWIHDDWNGKVHSETELKQLWETNDSITMSQSVDRDKFGGFSNTKKKATGFFRTEEIDGKWWIIDPLGNLFLGTGVNGVRYVKYEYTSTYQRDYIFEELPPTEFQRSSIYEYPSPEVSYTQWNLFRRYGENWKKEWEDYTVKRMKKWGLNNTNWSNTELQNDIPYAKYLKHWGIESGVMGMPDVYSESLVQQIDSLAKVQCTALKDDPWLIGYYTGNEPVWPGRESLTVDAILNGPKTKTQKKLISYLNESDTPERRKEFIISAYTAYLIMMKNAIKKYDSNHLILGTRLGGDPSVEAIQLAKLFDAVSLNIYEREIPVTFLDSIYELSGKPIIIGEFHIGSTTRGLASGLVQAKNDKEKAIAYQYYVENAFAHPAVIATTWYKWRDDPASGHEEGENYNIGIIDITDQAYPDLVQSIVNTHKRILEVHSGKTEPFNQIPLEY